MHFDFLNPKKHICREIALQTCSFCQFSEALTWFQEGLERVLRLCASIISVNNVCTPKFVCFKLTFTHFSLFSAQLLPSDKPWVQTGDRLSGVLSDSVVAVAVVAGCLREVCQGKKDS